MTVATTVEFDIDARCVGCGTERALDGSLIAEGERTMVVEAPNACTACGERRVKVTIDVGETGTKTED